jgi:hypothetical protein
MHCFFSFEEHFVSFSACPTTHIPETKPFDPFPPSRCIGVHILCKRIDWQVLHIPQALDQISTVFSNMVHFYINADRINSKPEYMDSIEWLQLLCPFVILCYICLYNAPSGDSLLGSSLVRLAYPAGDGKITLSHISSSAVPLSSRVPYRSHFDRLWALPSA